MSEQRFFNTELGLTEGRTIQAVSSVILTKLNHFLNNFDYQKYTVRDVRLALIKDNLSVSDFGALLSPAAENLFEDMAYKAKILTRKHFGNSINLYTPLYISNYCQNQCIYCGFNNKNNITRAKLSIDEINNEFKKISQTELKEILILTGEDRSISNIEYIGEAVKSATTYFTTIGLEIYPLDTDEYKYLQNCGADFVSIYQETYDSDLYQKYHLSGPKKDYDFRFNAQERAINADMRGVSFGALLGLGDFRKDTFATGIHAYLIQQKYPDTEISFSVPRLRNFNNKEISNSITEKNLFQVMMALRIFMPYATINISTREKAVFRDNVIGLVANKISAEVKTSVGGHLEKKGDEQFNISDNRDVVQIHNAIIKKGLQPVYSNFIRL